MALSPERSARFARQLVIPEIGAAGQEKLQNSSVLIIGAGGLGSPAALYLAAAGVGRPECPRSETGIALICHSRRFPSWYISNIVPASSYQYPTSK